MLDEASEEKARIRRCMHLCALTSTLNMPLPLRVLMTWLLLLSISIRPQLLDELEPQLGAGGTVVEFHTVDFFPERWFNLVLVLRTNNTVLYDRLVARCAATTYIIVH